MRACYRAYAAMMLGLILGTRICIYRRRSGRKLPQPLLERPSDVHVSCFSELHEPTQLHIIKHQNNHTHTHTHTHTPLTQVRRCFCTSIRSFTISFCEWAYTHPQQPSSISVAKPVPPNVNRHMSKSERGFRPLD